MSEGHVDVSSLTGEVEAKLQFRGRTLSTLGEEFRNKEPRLSRLWGARVSLRRWCCYPNSTACSALCSAAFVRLDYLIEASEILCDGMA